MIQIDSAAAGVRKTWRGNQPKWFRRWEYLNDSIRLSGGRCPQDVASTMHSNNANPQCVIENKLLPSGKAQTFQNDFGMEAPSRGMWTFLIGKQWSCTLLLSLLHSFARKSRHAAERMARKSALSLWESRMCNKLASQAQAREAH